MAIMQKCCCFDNVRSGSTAAGIYSIIYALIAVGFGGWEIWQYEHQLGLSADSYVTVCIEIALLGLIFLTSIVLLVGVSKDSRGYLLPYMIVMPAMILLQCAYLILSIYALAQQYYYVAAWVYGIGIGFTALFTFMDGLCFLCVVSQYQELRDGRGRIEDVMAARSHINIITTTSPGFGGAVIVSPSTRGYPQPGYPPQSNYPPQQSYLPPQGYQPQQEYPAQQGYSAQQGYTAQPGYPPQQKACSGEPPGYTLAVENPPPYPEKEAP